MADKCETCDAFYSVNSTNGMCRARPPVPQFYGMEQVNVLGKRAMRPICGTNFPEVPKDGWCREYSPIPTVKVFDPSKLAASGEATTINGPEKQNV